MRAPAYTLTQDSITVVWEGKSYVVQRGAPNYSALRDAVLQERWEDVGKNLTPAKSLKAYAKGKFSYDGNLFSYEGTKLPQDLNHRIIEMATRNEDPSSFFKFWERLQQNPSKRSVDQLWGFLQHQGIPITEDGCFLAYKGVTSDYLDKHSGKFDNTPGAVHEMPRNQISDDPRQACHEGFHVGALGYAQGFASIVVICKVDPADVVCVPYDESQQKMRVCRYEVVGNHNGRSLPSTSIKGHHSAKAAQKAKVTKKTNKKFVRLEKMDTADLMKQSIDSLRKYASQALSIVGASKMPGGKTALVKRIMEVRQ